MDQKVFITIAGNIGVGKSTLTNKAASFFNWTPFHEPHNENPFLSDFYDDMKRWSFHSQIYFLSKRLQQHYKLLKIQSSVIQDRSVYEDAEIFARNLYLQGYISMREWNTYKELYETLVMMLDKPDLVVYLKASVETLQKRIIKRGREYEKNISIDYLKQLNDLYEEWISNFDLCPVFTIETDEIDFVSNQTHLLKVFKTIKIQVQNVIE